MTVANNKMWMPSGFKQKIKELVLEIAHAKRKRCLAMARLCLVAYWTCPEYKEPFYERWRKRWLEIAEFYAED